MKEEEGCNQKKKEEEGDVVAPKQLYEVKTWLGSGLILKDCFSYFCYNGRFLLYNLLYFLLLFFYP